MKTPLKILLSVLGALYVLSPYDALPDFLPLLGQTDDLFVIFAVLYYLWKINIFHLFRRRPVSETANQQNSASGESTGSGEAGNRSGSASDTPYGVLGLEPDAGPEEIREAYRRLSQQYHPDKVAHLGQELQNLANSKFIEIQKAYEKLKKKGGW